MTDLSNVTSGPALDPDERRVHDSNYVLNELKAFFLRSRDAFGRLDTVSGSRNVLDIASHYNFSPERLRLFRNGAREFPQYNTVTQFTDNPDHWLLSPDAGDTMHIESAETGTYVVNFTLQASFAFQLNQSLSDGDVLRWGAYNGTDGWIAEQRGADHTDTQVDIIESVAGTETTLESDVELARPTTAWHRRQLVYGWYAILNQVWSDTYIEDRGTVLNDVRARTDNEGSRGPETGNLNLWIEVQADAATSGLELEVGSMGMITVGDPTSLQRDKPQYESITLSGTNDAWEPLLAVRIDPDNADVNAQLTELEILNYGNNADVELLVVSVDADKTDASGFSPPEYHHAFNSALQSTESITQIPDLSGTQSDFGTGDAPGGYTMAAAVELSGGNRSGTAGTSNQARQEKKAILNSDHMVFLGRTSSTGGVLDFVWDADQNW